MACDRCGYSSCYSYHSCPICNPKKPDYAANLHQAQAQQAAIDSAFEGVVRFLLALFLHPWLCFVGFWILCWSALILSAPLFGLADNWGNSLETAPDWYRYAALVIPVVLAVVFRKFIRPLMKWILIVTVSLLVLWGVVELVIYLMNRE